MICNLESISKRCEIYDSQLLRDAVKNYLADFVPLRGGGGGVAPKSAKLFGQNDFLLRGGKTPLKTAIFGQKR